MNSSDRPVEHFLHQLHALQNEKGDKLELEDVEQLLCSLGDSQISVLLGGIQSIASRITKFKLELSSGSPQDLNNKIPDASEQLQQVLESTEDAANKIMDSAEAIQNIAMDIGGEPQEKIIEHVTAIFEASNFQDLTGQRINNVVDTLIEIDSTIFELVEVLEKTLNIEVLGKDTAANDADADQDLMNGPQLDKDAPTQDDIDKLFDTL